MTCKFVLFVLQEGEDEIKVVAVKKGNCDEINIDKVFSCFSAGSGNWIGLKEGLFTYSRHSSPCQEQTDA